MVRAGYGATIRSFIRSLGSRNEKTGGVARVHARERTCVVAGGRLRLWQGRPRRTCEKLPRGTQRAPVPPRAPQVQASVLPRVDPYVRDARAMQTLKQDPPVFSFERLVTLETFRLRKSLPEQLDDLVFKEGRSTQRKSKRNVSKDIKQSFNQLSVFDDYIRHGENFVSRRLYP